MAYKVYWILVWIFHVCISFFVSFLLFLTFCFSKETVLVEFCRSYYPLNSALSWWFKLLQDKFLCATNDCIIIYTEVHSHLNFCVGVLICTCHKYFSAVRRLFRSQHSSYVDLACGMYHLYGFMLIPKTCTLQDYLYTLRI